MKTGVVVVPGGHKLAGCQPSCLATRVGAGGYAAIRFATLTGEYFTLQAVRTD